MLHLILQQLWKLLLFSSGKKASVETLTFLLIESSSDFFGVVSQWERRDC